MRLMRHVRRKLDVRGLDRIVRRELVGRAVDHACEAHRFELGVWLELDVVGFGRWFGIALQVRLDKRARPDRIDVRPCLRARLRVRCFDRQCIARERHRGGNRSKLEVGRLGERGAERIDVTTRHGGFGERRRIHIATIRGGFGRCVLGEDRIDDR